MANGMNCKCARTLSGWVVTRIMHNCRRPSKTAVRLRQENNSSGGSKFILTVKSRLRIEGGVSVAEENEQEVDQSVANRILSDPHNVFATDSSLTANGIHLKY